MRLCTNIAISLTLEPPTSQKTVEEQVTYTTTYSKLTFWIYAPATQRLI